MWFHRMFKQILILVLFCVGTAFTKLGLAAEYDPSRAPNPVIRMIDLSFGDPARSRELPIRVYLPESKAAAPVILFSHGLGGSREGSAFLGRHWAANGYLAVFMQHPGSDDLIWKDSPQAQRMQALRQAASLENFMARAGDVSATLNQLERWHKTTGHDLYGRVDSLNVGMSGHSFGAVTTQAVSGQRFPNGAQLTEPRIKAALILSPSAPKVAAEASRSFASVTMPWLLMTGTKDTFIIGGASVDSRLAVYPALPAGDKFELVLERAEHSAFVETALRGDTEPRNPNHHRALMAISTAFWDSYLRNDSNARQWLLSDAVRRVLESGDRWQLK
jgi:predicted dienelactone hydrolase